MHHKGIRHEQGLQEKNQYNPIHVLYKINDRKSDKS